MKILKCLLSGIFLLLLGIAFTIITGGRSWGGAAGIILSILGSLVFIRGLFYRDNKNDDNKR
ncbi:MAG: hypothetical protein VB118_05285 [Oscillospiraceae bacterium]|nr:hypothetical protein [Oscillospiraceae bacterium]